MYTEIEINKCSEGTFYSTEDWPLIHDQAIFFYLNNMIILPFDFITKSITK